MKKLPRLANSSKVFVSLAVIYAAFSFILPTNNTSKAELNVSDLHYTLILLAIRLPIILVWCLSFFAYRQMVAYSNTIKQTPEGAHFAEITKGLSFIVWGLLLAGLGAAILNSIANVHEDLRMYSIIITNYMYVLITLIAFSHISSGGHHLARRAKVLFTTNHVRWIVFVFVILGVLFCYLIAGRLHGNNAGDSYNAYYLPNIIVWATIVVPYLYAWFLGVFAALEIMLVARNTPGIIYKRALQYLAVGLVILIVAMCLLQYFRAVVPRTGKLNLGASLMLTYGIYVSSAIGSLIMARGARQLRKIEEI